MTNLIEDVTKDYEKHYNSIPYETFIEILKLDPQTKFVNNEPDKIGPNASGLLLQRYMKGDTEFLNYGEEVYNAIDAFIKNRASYPIKNIREFQNNTVREFINYVENPESLNLNTQNKTDKLTQIYDKYYSSIDRETFNKILKMDPKTNIEKGLIGDVAKNLLLPKYLAGETDFINLENQIERAIEDFEEFKSSYPQDKRSISNFESVSDFVNYVLAGPKSNLVLELENDERVDSQTNLKVKDSFKLLGSTKNYDVIEVWSHLANNVVIGGSGEGTSGYLSWCTGYGISFFNNYHSRGRLICFIHKTERKNKAINYQLNISSTGENLEFLNGFDSNPISSNSNSLYNRKDEFLKSVLLKEPDLIPIVIADKDLCKNIMVKDLNDLLSGSSNIGTLEFESIEDINKIKASGLTQLVRKVVIKDGVTNIPDGAFENFSSIKEIQFADSVTRIGIRSFAGCSDLRKLILPKNLEIIEIGAFMNCSNLKGSVALPITIKYIGHLAFENHNSQGLKFTIPKEIFNREGAKLQIAKEDAFWWRNPRHLRAI